MSKQHAVTRTCARRLCCRWQHTSRPPTPLVSSCGEPEQKSNVAAAKQDTAGGNTGGLDCRRPWVGCRAGIREKDEHVVRIPAIQKVLLPARLADRKQSQKTAA